MDGGDHRSGVAVSIHDEAPQALKTGLRPRNPLSISESDREHSDDNSMGEGSGREARRRPERVEIRLSPTLGASVRGNHGRVEAGSLDQSDDGRCQEVYIMSMAARYK